MHNEKIHYIYAFVSLHEKYLSCMYKMFCGTVRVNEDLIKKDVFKR